MLLLGTFAIAGMPPMGVFMSEFLLVSSTIAREPLLALPLVVGLLVGFGALLGQTVQMAFGEGTGEPHGGPLGYLPALVHLGLVIVAGVYIPGPIVAWFQEVAALLG
jgi:hydrogenase-4 component F